MADKSQRYFFGGPIRENRLTDFLGLTTPAPTQIPAPPLSSFPSEADAQYAIQQGFGYGSGNEPYIEGKRANIYDRRMVGDPSAMIAAPSTNTDLTQFKNIDELNKVRTLHAQTALAANRSAIASLGYDPDKVNLQTKAGPLTHGGLYSPDQDRVWVNVSGEGPQSSTTHESIHRGLEQLRANPEAAALIKKLPDEESVVRYMMAKTMGDPEINSGEAAQQQRKKALNYWLNEDYSNNKRMARLEEIAADMRKNRRPGGPR